MGVNKIGMVNWRTDMNSRNHCTNSSVVWGYQAQNPGESTDCEHAQTLKIFAFGGVGPEDEVTVAVKLREKMRLELGHEEGVQGQSYPVHVTGHDHLTNLLLKSGAGHELSVSMPNLNASLNPDLINQVNEKPTRSSLSNIFDGKPEMYTKRALTDITKCIKTVSTEDFRAGVDGPEGRYVAHQGDLPPQQTSGNLEDLKIDVYATNSRLSAVLENIPLLYIPHTKQLVSINPQPHESVPLVSKEDETQPCMPSLKYVPQDKIDRGHQRNGMHSSCGDDAVVTRIRTVENGSWSPNASDSQVWSLNDPLTVASLNHTTMDGSLDSRTTVTNIDSDGMCTLSQDSDTSSTCRSEHTVIHQDDIHHAHRDTSFDFDTDSIGRLSKISLERESPRNTIRRTNTMGSLSKGDTSSFSSISSISTGTDFSASATSYSDDYLEMRSGMEVDDTGFMDVNLHSRNTFERSRNSSQDSGIDEKQCQGAKPKRRGISSFFAR